MRKDIKELLERVEFEATLNNPHNQEITADETLAIVEYIKDLDTELSHVSKVLEKCSHRVQRYRETLEFYANRENYKPKHYDPNSDNGYMSTIDYDEGEKARQALESVEN